MRAPRTRAALAGVLLLAAASCAERGLPDTDGPCAQEVFEVEGREIGSRVIRCASDLSFCAAQTRLRVANGHVEVLEREDYGRDGRLASHGVEETAPGRPRVQGYARYGAADWAMRWTVGRSMQRWEGTLPAGAVVQGALRPTPATGQGRALRSTFSVPAWLDAGGAGSGSGDVDAMLGPRVLVGDVRGGPAEPLVRRRSVEGGRCDGAAVVASNAGDTGFLRAQVRPLVGTAPGVDEARASRQKWRITGAPAGMDALDGGRQRIESSRADMTVVRVLIDSSEARFARPDEAAADARSRIGWEMPEEPFAQSTSKRFREESARLRARSSSVRELASLIVTSTSRRIEPRATPLSPDGLAAWEAGFGDCDDAAWAATGLLRAAGVPARMVSGVALRDGVAGWHAWVEYWDGRWVAADPHWGQHPADETHLRLGIGEAGRQAIPQWLSTRFDRVAWDWEMPSEVDDASGPGDVDGRLGEEVREGVLEAVEGSR